MKFFAKVDDYIAHACTEARPKLSELRSCIRSILPKATEKIWYGVPFYHENGEAVGFSVAKHHVSVGLGAELLSEFRRQKLKAMGFRTGKCTLQIQFDQKIPVALLREMLKEKVRRNRSKKITGRTDRL